MTTSSVLPRRNAGWLPARSRWVIPVVTVLGLASFLFEAVGIYLIVPLVDRLLPTGQAPQNGLIDRIVPSDLPMGTLILVIVGCILMKGLASLGSSALTLWAAGRTSHELRIACFDRIVRATESYQSSRETGEFLNLLGNETWRAGEGLQALAALVTHSCAMIIFVGLMLLLSPFLTVAVVVGFAVILGFVRLSTAIARREGAVAVAVNRELAGRVAQGLDGLASIRMFGREKDEIARFTTVSERARRVFLRVDMMHALPGPAFDVLFALLLGALILAMEGGRVSVLIAFLALLQRMQPHAVAITQSRLKLSTLRAANDSIRTLLDASDSLPMTSGTLPAPRPAAMIELREVTLNYRGTTRSALDGVTIQIPAGRTTALVGRSGAGKSTLIRLVCRLADPDSGQVIIDGTDIREIDLAGWRSRCAVVPQDVFLFDTSISDNIAYGRPDATPAEIEAAARAAQAHDFITALPAGYDEKVGERGTRLSGGQRQRIALARALLRNAGVLVLDEATNALDHLSQRLVQDALAASENRTVLLVAHQLSSVEKADHIIVLDDGRVVEQGSPEALRALRGSFVRLFEIDRKSA